MHGIAGALHGLGPNARWSSRSLRVQWTIYREWDVRRDPGPGQYAARVRTAAHFSPTRNRSLWEASSS